MNAIVRPAGQDHRFDIAAPWPFSLVTRRAPDITIGGQRDPYMRRWWLLPKNRFFNVYLHQFIRSDDPRALHDHPWWNCSILLRGFYMEVTTTGIFFRKAGHVTARRASLAHRVVLLPACHSDGTIGEQQVWTLFVTGPHVRDWGFLCPSGWRSWKSVTNPDDGGQTMGKGCD